MGQESTYIRSLGLKKWWKEMMIWLKLTIKTTRFPAFCFLNRSIGTSGSWLRTAPGDRPLPPPQKHMGCFLKWGGAKITQIMVKHGETNGKSRKPSKYFPDAFVYCLFSASESPILQATLHPSQVLRFPPPASDTPWAGKFWPWPSKVDHSESLSQLATCFRVENLQKDAKFTTGENNSLQNPHKKKKIHRH